MLSTRLLTLVARLLPDTNVNWERLKSGSYNTVTFIYFYMVNNNLNEQDKHKNNK